MKNRRALCVAVGLACSGLVNVAGAQGLALEEVVVTAQKTEETIQSVPISIQALDSKVLQNNAVNSFSDIKALVPSMKIVPFSTAQENLMINIRGINAGAVELTQDTPTAVHINGVYIARGNGLNMSVADLERVEVLRGPQGTLYGRNATAGAINLITSKPTDTFSFKQQVTIAEQDQILTRTSVNVPITDNLFAKLSYLYDDKEGFVHNSAPGGIDFGDRTAQGARLDMRWEPAANLTIDYSYDWNNSRYYSTPGQCLEVGSRTSIFSTMDPSECSKSFKDEISYYGKLPKNAVTADGHTLAVEWDLGAVTFRSITAQRGLNDNYYGILFGGGPNLIGGSADLNFGGFSLPAASNHTKQHQFSQEFQFLGDIGDRISYSTGLYYFREKGTETKGYSAAVTSIQSPAQVILSMNGPRDLAVENESAAVFGQMTWTPPILDNNLEIVPGIRFTRDKRKASMFEKRGGTYIVNPLTGAATLIEAGSSAPTYTGYQDTPTAMTGRPAQYDDEFSQTTPSLTVQYHVNADIMTYAKYVKGYKSGGTAVRASNTAAFEQGFDPETLTSVELGLKSSWFDQRLRLNADVFQSKFKDRQVTVRNAAAAAANDPSVPFDIVNAGRSTYNGAELELEAAVTEGLRLRANYAYLQFKYDSVRDPASGVDVSRFYHSRVPTNSYSVTADYHFGDIGFGQLSANLTYAYTDAQSAGYQDNYTLDASGAVTSFSKADTRQFVTPSYGTWNGRVALSDIAVGPGDKGSLTIALWGKNLADEKYYSYNYPTVAAAAQYQTFWGEPRTLGIDFIYQYE